MAHNDQTTKPRDDQTTKPQAKRIKYSPPQLLKLDAQEGKGACENGSGDGSFCRTGGGASDSCLSGTAPGSACVTGISR